MGACGILGLIWLCWTPQSGEGMIVFAAVTLGALLTVAVVGNLKDGKNANRGYKPWDGETTSRKDQIESHRN
jgi:hypothetical protein